MSRPRKGKILRIGGLVFVMGDLISRIGRFFFDGARNIDRTVLCVDVLVLVVIVAEWIRAERREARRDHASSQRVNLIETRIAKIRELMADGQKLQNNVPGMFDSAGAGTWTQIVNSWMANAQAVLKTYSPQAEAAFMTDSRDPKVNYPKANPMLQSLLASRIKNMQRIMEKPDTYL